jgi:hypothetical protein
VTPDDLAVLSPAGLPVTQSKGIAPRLDTLEGKVVGEVYNHHFKGDQMFALYRRLLQERYPGVRIVPFTEMPASYVGGDPATQRRIAQEVAQQAREKGIDALIAGNGG